MSKNKEDITQVLHDADNKKGKEGITGYEYYENIIIVDDKKYIAHIRVRKTNMGDKYYGHTVSQVVDEIKIEPLARSSDEKTTVHPVNASGSNTMIAQEGNLVKNEAMVVNESGETFDNEYAAEMQRENPMAYRNIVRMAKRLKMKIYAVENLTNSKGKKVDGLITKDGIFIDKNAKKSFALCCNT